MVNKHSTRSSAETNVAHGPHTTSYDSGYEHSLEHWTEVKRLVEEAGAESEAPAVFADHGILVEV